MLFYLGDQVCGAVVLLESDQSGLVAVGLQRQVCGVNSSIGAEGNRG